MQEAVTDRMSYLSPDLVKVELRVSGVLPFALDAVWPVARQFGSLCFLRSYAGEPVDSALLVRISAAYERLLWPLQCSPPRPWLIAAC